MKIILLVLTLLSLNTAHAEREGHGGDPLEIHAVEFPDKPLLDSAVQIAEGRLRESKYFAPFRENAISEMLRLYGERKYMTLPNLIILTPIAENGNQDAEKFISLGAITRNKRGARVYFAERVLKYTPDQLAELVLHEVIHHVVAPGLAEDETFVTAMSQSLMNRTYTNALAKAAEFRIYMQPKYVSATQLRDALLYTIFGDEWDELRPKEREYLLKYTLDNWYGKIRNFSYNIAGWPLKLLMHRFPKDVDDHKHKDEVLKGMRKLALQLDPQNPWAKDYEYIENGGCKVAPTLLERFEGSCAEGQYLSIGEYFTVAE